MKLVNFYRKPISVFVMVTFTVLLCFLANQAPAAAPAPATENNSGTTLENGGNGNPNFFEQERKDVNTVKKSHKFPWLLVGAVVVVGAAAAYYFLALNKKVILTVTLGIGASGTPAATTKYKKGETVAYNYLPQAGYGSLLVKLDGVAVAASGTLKMDKDHTLEVSATQEFTLTVSVGVGVTGIPVAGTTTYKNGTAVTYSYSLQSGYSNLSVTLDGVAVTAHGTVTMNANHTLAASAAKNFILTVNRGEHVTGTPASGAYTYTSGTNVAYNYSPAAGYSNLEVKIDNVAAPTAGTIAMDANHTLTANLFGTNIEVNSTPAGAHIYLDNVDSGFSTPHTFNYATAVTKEVLLRYSCGYKEYAQTVTANLGKTITINATLVKGIMEEFNVPASSCWGPYHPANWSTSAGSYKCKGTPWTWSPNVYQKYFSGDYTVTVRMNRKTGSTEDPNAIFLATGTSSTNNSGYVFAYNGMGWFSAWRLTNYNLITASGTIEEIFPWQGRPAIPYGLNKWNTLKITKVGYSYTFYINKTYICSFASSVFNPAYCFLISYSPSAVNEIYYDYVYLNTGASMDSVPGQPVQNVPATDKENLLRIPITGKKNN